MEKVSIVLPVYNAESYVAEAISSVLNQDYPLVEVIVVNDGSTDNSEKEILKFKDQILYIKQINQGQAVALNNGWNACSGSLIGYLSADDVLLPAAIRKSVNQLGAFVGAYCDYELIDINSKPIQKVKAPDFSRRDLIDKMLCQPGPGALFKKEFYVKTKGWDASLKQLPDYDFWLKLTQYGDLKRIPEVLAQFRVHEESQSFMAPTQEKAEEPIIVMQNFKESNSTSMARAHILSARLHAKAFRVLPFLKHCSQALLSDPCCYFKIDTWKLILSGWLSRITFFIKRLMVK